VPGSGGSLRYLAETGNGRDWLTEPGVDPEGRDVDDAKAINVGLSYRPDRLQGAEFGVSFYRDWITSSEIGQVDHRIGVAYAVYRTPAIEIMGEWLNLWYRTPTGAVTRNPTGYAQFSRAFGKVRPYYRFDRLAIDHDAPFVGDIGSYTAHTIGVRLDPGAWVGLKSQYVRSFERERWLNSAGVELVFVF
jgi:hypothetical protein